MHHMMAEVSITPIGTGQSSVSFYVAQAIEAVSDMKQVRFRINAMGTIMESEDGGALFEAAQRMIQAVHNLGVPRVGVILKIDSRTDKLSTASDKVESVRRHMNLEGADLLE